MCQANKKCIPKVSGTTVCSRSSDPFYKVTYYKKMGNYFLDMQQYTVCPIEVKTECIQHGTYIRWYCMSYAQCPIILIEMNKASRSQKNRDYFRLTKCLKQIKLPILSSTRPRSRFQIVGYYIKWVTTSWTHSKYHAMYVSYM